MCDDEDLAIGDEEKRAGALLRWLNDRGCSYHIEVGSERRSNEFHASQFGFLRTFLLYDVLIYEDETATLMNFFHEDFKEIISPEDLEQRQKPLEQKPERQEASLVEDDASPPTRGMLQRFGKMIFGPNGGHHG